MWRVRSNYDVSVIQTQIDPRHALRAPLPATLDMSIRHPPHVEQVLPLEHEQNGVVRSLLG